MASLSLTALSRRRVILLLLAGLLLALSSRGGVAGQPSELYQAAVPVSGQGVEERNGAIAQALGLVLVKVTGSRSAAQGQEAKGLAGEAAGLVQQYRYEMPPGAAAEGRLLLVSFDPRALDQALRDRGLPVWGGARPTLLLWLGVDQGGQRRFFQPETDAAQAQVVERVGEERGIAFLFPLMDVEDLTRLQVAELWGGFESPIREASERYGADLVLVGRMGLGSVSWQLLYADQVEKWRSSGDDALAEGLEQAVDRIVARYAPQAAPGAAAGVLVRVRGVMNLNGFVRVDRFLKSLDAVQSALLEGVEPEQVLYRLSLRGGPDALARSASLGGVLRVEPPEPAPAAAAGETQSTQIPDMSFRLIE